MNTQLTFKIVSSKQYYSWAIFRHGRFVYVVLIILCFQFHTLFCSKHCGYRQLQVGSGHEMLYTAMITYDPAVPLAEVRKVYNGGCLKKHLVQLKMYFQKTGPQLTKKFLDSHAQ